MQSFVAPVAVVGGGGVFEEKPGRVLFIKFVEDLELQVLIPRLDAVDPCLYGSLVEYQRRVGVLLVDGVQ